MPARRDVVPPDEGEKSSEIGQQGGDSTAESKATEFKKVVMHLEQKRTQRSIINQPVVGIRPRQPEQRESPEMPASPEEDDQQTPPTQRVPCTIPELVTIKIGGSN